MTCTEKGRKWLREELDKPTRLEILIARCEKARDAAKDPDSKIIWEGKARELREKTEKMRLSLYKTFIDFEESLVESPWGKCFKCGEQMIHGGDHDEEDVNGQRVTVSNFHCPGCDSDALFYWS